MSENSASSHDAEMKWANRIMAAATAIMTVATVVMMYSGCQQQRLAVAAEKRAAAEENRTIIAAKRQVQKAGFIVMTNLVALKRAQTRGECMVISRSIGDVMELSDNLYLVSRPDLAKTWYEVRGRFAMLVIDNVDLIVRGTNAYTKNQYNDELWLRMTAETLDEVFPKFWKLYDDLQLSELFPTNSAKVK